MCDVVFCVSPKVARQPSDKRASNMSLELWRQEMFLLFPRDIYVSLATDLSHATKFPRWLNWEKLRHVLVS